MFGDVVWCPRCRGTRRLKVAKKTGDGHKFIECDRCHGEGIVPNKGPIAPPKKP